jgi:hypothetical protein
MGAGLNDGCRTVPVSYRRRRARTLCAAMTVTLWSSAFPSRKMPRPLPSALVGNGWLRVGDNPENKRVTRARCKVQAERQLL